jgi:precorrin-2 dehydrogenase / sirohydrochlorin ferrochelatase
VNLPYDRWMTNNWFTIQQAKKNMSSPPFAPIQRGGSLLIAYQLSNRRVLLVGGGLVAASRLSALISADALVTLVAPRSGLCTEVRYRIDEEKCVDRYVDREFLPEDLDDPEISICLTAIDDEKGLQTSSRIHKLCKEKRIPVNVADVPPECDFYFGSIIRRGPLQLLISTGGKGPRLAHHIKRRIEAAIPKNVEAAIEGVGKLRAELRIKAPGKGKDTVKARMEWMTELCDSWTLEELGELEPDEELRATVLRGAVS